MAYSIGKKWTRLKNYLGWTGEILDLRTFVLYAISVMPSDLDDVRRVLIRYYFKDEEKDKTNPADSRFHQFLVEGRRAISISNTILDRENPDYRSFKYRNENEVIDEIMEEMNVRQ